MRKTLMRIGAVVLGFILLTLATNLAEAGKVNWGANGKPQIEKSEKPIKGCTQGGLGSLGQDNNKTNSCKTAS